MHLIKVLSFMLVLKAGFFLTVVSSSASAQRLSETYGDTLETALISHEPPPQLNVLGSKVELKATLKNTKKFSYPMILNLVKDGQSIRIKAKEGVLDDNDIPIYTFTFDAPKSSLSYSFHLLGPNNRLINSQEFNIIRDCIPNTQEVVVPKVPNYLEGEKVTPMAEKVTMIEQEILSYERSIELVKSLEQLVENLKNNQS